jgi:hypothetical protein
MGMDEDFWLRWLIATVEDSDFRTSITLSVHGTLLEGDLISEQEFFEGFASRITGDTPETQARDRENFSTMPSQFDAAAMQGLDEGEDPEVVREARAAQATSFIHMTNIRVFQAGYFHEFQETFWRGRIASVDGFWLGRAD